MTRSTAMLFLVLMVFMNRGNSLADEIYQCSDPQGVVLWSFEKHKPSIDGFKGVNPVFVVGKETVSIKWGDSASAGATEKTWQALIVHRDKEMVSAIALDAGDMGSAVMLYTIDMKRSIAYMSSHKNNHLLNGSSAASFAGNCKKL